MASNFCQNCEDLQGKTDENGNALPRKEYKQLTCYDHILGFQKYRQKIEFATKCEKCCNDMKTEATKFTNLQIDKKIIDDALKNFTPDELYQFKEQIQTGIIDINELKINQKFVENENELKSELLSESLLSCSNRSPIKCPISECNQIIGLTTILSHFLRDHQKHEYPLPHKELAMNENSKLKFPYKLFNLDNKVFCLGVLVYSGDGINSEKYPADQGICRKNSYLPKKFQIFSNHLPVLLLGGKTHFKYLANSSDHSTELNHTNEDNNIEILILWAATVDITKQIYCTITAYDKNRINSRSSIVPIRNLKDSQSPKDFIAKESNYLILNDGELNLLTANKTENLYLEVNIQEYE